METPPAPSLLADRRWLIGICISIAFGLFGAVMALLGYAERRTAPEPGAAPAAAPASPGSPAPRGGGGGKEKKGRGRD